MVDDAFRGFPGDDEQVSEVKKGDKVRMTGGESVIVGMVTGLECNSLFLELAGVNTRFYLTCSDWSIEVIAPPIPDVVGTIIRDRDGDAWQRHKSGWYLTNDTFSSSLYQLELVYGPFTVLYTPEATS